jgi:hypothetical protein
LFHETPEERVHRLTETKPLEKSRLRFWKHTTPDLTDYWLFIDVAKFGKDFKSFYLIVNTKRKINKGLTFVYNEEVIKFMELEQDEVYDELYSTTFNNAEAEIKADLMITYEQLSEQKYLNGKSNIFFYVFENFQLTSLNKNNLIFTVDEINTIRKAINKIDNFLIKKDLEAALNTSELINRGKNDINI